MPFLSFLRENARWIAGGFLLTFFSSFGQTFFISLSAGEIRREFGLSHGDFGLVYMIATLGSAFTLPWLGRIVDLMPTRRVVLLVVPMLAAACVAIAFASHIAILVAAIYLLRLFGQGMMTQTAFTSTGRWFAAQRGRAVSIVTLGHNAGEALFPLLVVLVAGLVGWRNAWLAGAAVLLAAALPAIAALVAVERAPRASDPQTKLTGRRQWERAEVLRDPVFYLLLVGVLAPGFIGTTIFFHQVYLVELRGWTMESFAASFSVMAAMTVVFALVAGHLIDRFTGVALLPFFLVPLGCACLVLGLSDEWWSVYAFMALLGLSYGFSSTLFGAIWPEIYGTKNLGSIRASTVAVLVFATAAGPGLTGYLIDRGTDLPTQVVFMGVYCFLACFALYEVARRVRAREPLGR